MRPVRFPRKTAAGHVVLAVFSRPTGKRAEYDVLAYVSDMGLVWGRGFDMRRGIWTGADYYRSIDEIRTMASRDILVWSNPVAVNNVIAREPSLSFEDMDWLLRAPEHA